MGKDIFIEYRLAKSGADQLPDLAAELVGLKVAVIVTTGTPATLAAKKATATIPIVMVGAGDPVGSGLIASLARPGGNITGSSSLAPELAGKRLEILQEVFPKTSRVAVLWDPLNPANALTLKATEVAAKELGLQLRSIQFQNLNDLSQVFSTITKKTPMLSSFSGGWVRLRRHSLWSW